MHTARAIRTNPRLAWAILACCIAAAAPALAQSQLPRDLPAKQQLSAADNTTLKTFADDWTAQLVSTDPAEAAAAVKALNAPFKEQDITVAFRLAYSNAIAPTLDNLVADADARVAFVAASLAGKIATTRTARVLESAIEDDRPAVRYAAAVGYRELLEPVFADLPLAISDTQLPKVYAAIERAIEAEQDPHVVEGLITAVSGAGAASNTQAADAALTALARATAKLASRLAASPPSDQPARWDRAIYRSIKQSYDVSLQQQIERGQIDTEFARQSAIASGLALAYVQRRIESQDLTDNQATSALAPLAEIAERFLVIVNTQVNPNAPLTGNKAERAAKNAIDTADPNRYADAIDEYMSVIKRSPYSVPASQLP